MNNTCKIVRVFMASPSDLQPEREAFYTTITEINEQHATYEGIIFHGVGGDKVNTGYGRSQTIINRELQNCDFSIFAFWERWGSPPGGNKFSSGCQEEFEIACRCKKNKTMQNIGMYFKKVDPQKLHNPCSQLKQVIRFRKKIEKNKAIHFREFETPEQYARELRALFHDWIREIRADTVKKPTEINVKEFSTGHEDTMRGGPNG